MGLATPPRPRSRIPDHLRPSLLPVAKNAFWWGDPAEWLEDKARFIAQVMTFGDWNDTILVSRLLDDAAFEQVLADPPPGVFDIKSWTYWHLRFGKSVPPLPIRKV